MKRSMFNSKKTKRGIISLSILGLLVFSVSILSFTSCTKKADDQRLVVGWQTAWATCGQLVETMVHTNIPSIYSTGATFRNFLFGPDMLEAALGGNLDVTTVGVVPAINLLAASDDWVVVCRLIDFSCVTIARTGSGIMTYADLKGKKLGVPFGSGAHPYIVQRLNENKLTHGAKSSDVELINVSPAEAMVVVQQGGVDAMGIWEPNATIIESKGLGKAIDEKRYIGLMLIRKSIVEKNPEQVVALIKSLIEANLYVAKNREQSDEWFAKRSGMNKELLKKIRIIEPNLKAKKIEDVSVQISAEDMALSQQVADQMFDSKLIKRKVIISEHTNLLLAKQATEEIIKEGSKESKIKLEEKK
ncbi:MAG: ABC transporter substrate-binding protein [Paludibacter sp.]